MFKELSNIIYVDLSNFDTSQVTNMHSMFESCVNLEEIVFGNINTSSVNNMERLFRECKKLSSIDLSKFDTSSVTDMSCIFSYCESLKTIDASSFNTENVVKMPDFISHGISLVFANLSSFRVPKVESMQGMFYQCTNLKYVDLQGLGESNYINNLFYLFLGCSPLKYVNLRTFIINNKINNMFNENSFINSENVKYCLEDLETKNYLLVNKNVGCSDLCFQENICYDIEKNMCFSKETYKFEYNSQCYMQCPNDTFPILEDKYICSQINPENYYYLDINDNIYKKCYSTCKKCRESGDDNNNHCDECKNSYKYQYNNNCYENCPSNTKIYEDGKKCLDECNENQFQYINNCYDDACPNNTYKIDNSNICIGTCPENYFLDNNICKECYSTCKICNKAGDEANHNCLQCKRDYIYEYNNNCYSVCPRETKIFEEQKICLDECYINQFEYNNICYIDCPTGTHRIFQNRNICIDTVPENYYFDNNDNIYKECYKTCKKCNKSGNEINNNCDECINNYIFLNDSYVKPYNCYKHCEYYYYFNETNHYSCTLINSCPQGSNKLIIQKNQCINDCKNDDEYLYEYKNNCIKECPTNTKIYEQEKICLDECYNYQFEYNKICYNDCPNHTFRLFQNRNICIDTVPENYYFDNNDNIYKECYKTCKKCNKSGNEINNNCDECINNYIFLNDSYAQSNNCYPQCEYYYYFNENNRYYCTINNTCPQGSNKLIIQKNKCISDCKNDDEYQYDYYNNCSKECPENMKIVVETKKCYEKCNDDQFENNYKCYNNFPNDTQGFFQNGNIFINNGSNFSNILNNVILSAYESKEGNSLLIKRNDNIVYHVTNSKNELDLLNNKSNNIQNISIIDLGECETILRKEYNIKEEDHLIIVKNEQSSSKASEKNVKFEVYEPINKNKLNLSLCDETPINIYFPLDLKKETKDLYEKIKEYGYDMFNINDSFYQDICTPYDSSNGTDILLTDRIDYIYNNDDTQCQPNCQFSSYSVESQYMNCICSPNEEDNNANNKNDKFSAKKIYESFYEVLKYSNYEIIKCFNIISKKKVISSNIGSIVVIIYFSVYLVCIIIFILKGISPLKNQLSNDLNKIKDKKNIDFKFNQNILYPPRKKNYFGELILKINKEQKAIAQKNKKTIIRQSLKNQNILDDKIQIYSNTGSRSKVLDNYQSNKVNNLKLKEIITHNKQETENNQNPENEYSDYELNELEYIEAIKLDKRTLLQIYWAILKREHLIIFTFINCNDYNLLYIKLSRFIFLIVGDMALNVFFFSDDSMHKLFLNYGKYDFIQQIPQITYSTIFSQIIEVFLCFLSLTDKYIYQLRSNIIEGNTNNISKVLKCVHIKLIIFFIFTFIFFAVYWYIISIFCGVYRNTQITFIKDSILSFSICLIYPVVIYFISASLRVLSLRDSKARFKCIYNFSYIIPFF